MKVLRLCSLFEPPPAAMSGRGVRFDPIGGMQSHTAGLSRALDRRGVTQTIVTTRTPTAARRELFGERSEVVRLGMPVRPFRQFYSWPAAAMLPKLAQDADLVHAHLGEDLAVVPLAFRAAAKRKLPVVLTVHTSLRHTLTVNGPRDAMLKSLGGGLEWWGAREATAVIALTNRLADLLRYDGVPADRIHVVPSGVVVTPVGQPLPAQVDPLAGIPHPRVVFLGRLHRQKQVEILIRAAVQVPAMHVVLAGDGPNRAALERLAAGLGLSKRVHFLGVVPHHEVPAVLRSADALALPSRYEEFGTSLLEGMQAGLPVVAAATGGIPHVIQHGVTGLLVPPGDADALAQGLRQVLTDRRLAQRLAGQARQRVLAYDWDRVAGRVLDLYGSLLSHPQPRALPAGVHPAP